MSEPSTWPDEAPSSDWRRADPIPSWRDRVPQLLVAAAFFAAAAVVVTVDPASMGDGRLEAAVGEIEIRARALAATRQPDGGPAEAGVLTGAQPAPSVEAASSAADRRVFLLERPHLVGRSRGRAIVRSEGRLLANGETSEFANCALLPGAPGSSVEWFRCDDLPNAISNQRLDQRE